METTSDSGALVVVTLLVSGALVVSVVVGLLASFHIKEADGRTTGFFDALIFVTILVLAVLYHDRVVGIITGGA